MASITDLSKASADPQLLTLFIAGIERQAMLFLFEPSNQPEKLWAKRAIGEFGINRAPWYAALSIKALLATNAGARDWVAAKLAEENPPDLTEQEFAALIATCVAGFVSNTI